MVFDELDSSSVSSESSSETESEPRRDDSNDAIVEIQLAATSAVNNGALLRGGVIFCFQLIGTMVTVLTYLILDTQRVRTFEMAMEKAALLVEGSIRRRVRHLFETLHQFGERIVSFADASVSSFPYITLPDWEEALDVRDESMTEIVAFAPLVEDFSEWRDYTQENNFSWIASEDTDSGEKSQSVLSLQWVNDSWLTTLHDEKKSAAPIWQVSPFENSLLNLDANSISRNDAFLQATTTTVPAFGTVLPPSFWEKSTQEFSLLTSAIQPISTQTGAVVSFFSWQHWFNSSYQPGECFEVVLRNDQEQTFTFRTGEGSNDTFQAGDHSDVYLGRYAMDFDLSFDSVGEATEYGFALVPCDSYYDQYTSSKPFAFALLIASMVIIAGNAFNLYDAIVSQVTKVILAEAFRASEVVEKLVPVEVRQRLFPETRGGGKQTFEQFMINKTNDGSPSGQPVAELYPQATIMMADIAGFTSWSSTRQPVQVFTLLETLYGAFDEKATTYNVFKVETIGDCYVAATGIPKPTDDHAVDMVQFAEACVRKTIEITKKLELSLGPGTSELAIRVGIHSGPVTVGILRGNGSRVQLFGDTMNVTSRVETTSQSNRIQLTQETARLLADSGREHWVQKRQDKIFAKGIGSVETYWLVFSSMRRRTSNRLESTTSFGSGTRSDHENQLAEIENIYHAKGKARRLIEWNVEILCDLLKNLVAKRDAEDTATSEVTAMMKREKAPIEEHAQSIQFLASRQDDSPVDTVEIVEVAECVVDQLTHYVTTIAHLYLDNPFHSFEHAAHVTMSVVKLLARITNPSQIESSSGFQDEFTTRMDPLTQFSLAFAAMVHDVDHFGVSNLELAKEFPSLAKKYMDKSIAEQNSFNIAWDLFVDGPYEDLRKLLCPTQGEVDRFRQLLIHALLATDIADKDLNRSRELQWGLAFADDSGSAETTDKKATMVIEHLMQASDIVHAMQHWHIFRKWNRKLFFEMKQAFHRQRSSTDPVEFWYEGELSFFDHYVIPLARRLKDSECLGAAADEFLSYALQNRSEWAEKGLDCVQEMIRDYEEEFL